MTELVPIYALYGEYLEEHHEDVLHFEAIRDRSAKYNWSILPHKHDMLWQFFYLQNAGIRMYLDGWEHMITEPVLVSVPPLFVHGFQFPDDVIGGVISVRASVVSQMLPDLVGGGNLSDRIVIMSQNTPDFKACMNAYDTIKTGFKVYDQLRNISLETNLKALSLAVLRHEQRNIQVDSAHRKVQEDDLLRRFCDLIENNYTANWSSADYARALGISTVQLNRKSAAGLGVSPQRFLTKRRILEAKRLLKFTQLSITEISQRLGYADPSYYCRLFKKHVGQTPSHFRQAHES
ncbi:MAG: hypothetical protein COB84_06650 [Rhodobacteraceae bacterium]|nr:MAG: hypothetical protein COB84_06650 [Paracoccaceae bacterium]